MSRVTEVRVRRQNDYIFSRWVGITYKGEGKNKRIYDFHFTTTKLGAEVRCKIQEWLNKL